MNGPTFVAIDPNRTIGSTTATWLYVSEHGEINNTGGGRILRFNLTSGGAATQIAGFGTGDGQFTSPDGIVVDSATGDLIIADRALDRIQRITNTGTFVMKFGSGTVGALDEMHGPSSIARDSTGAIYVAEHGETMSSPPGSGGSFVSKYTISGSGSSATATRAWRVGGLGNGAGTFNNTGPYGVAVNGSTLFVTDGFNSRVQALNLSGVYQTEFSIAGALPLGISLDSTGALWIAEATNTGDGSGAIQRARKYTTAGVYANVELSGGLTLPFDVAIDAATNRAYVSDYGNDRIAVFDLNATAPAVPTITSSASATGTVGAAFSTYSITATNGPITSYAAVDALPAGLNLNTSTGQITGTPTAAGTVTTHLTATNASGTSAQFALMFTVGVSTPPPASGPVVTSFSYVAHTLTFQITFSEPVTGVDLSDFVFYSSSNIVGGSLDSVVQNDPSHYTFNISYGSGAPGTMSITIKSSGTGIVGTTSGQPYTGAGVTKAIVPVTPHLQTDAPVVNSFMVGANTGNTVNFIVSFNKESWNIQPSNITVNTTGTASGTVGYIVPTDDTALLFTIPVTYTGSGTISLTLSNATQQTISDGNYNMYVGPNTSDVFTIPTSGSAPTIANQTASGTQNAALSYQVVATGATSYSVVGTPVLPAGLTLNATTGAITGTPTASGSTAVTVRATNTTGSTDATLTFNIAAAGAAPTIANQTASGTQNAALSYQVVATGATSYSVVGTPALPAGLTLNATTGAITGTPTASGSTAVTVRATNTTGSTDATLTFNIAAAGSAPTIANQTASGTQNAALSYQVVATGATSYSIVGTPALPAGLTLNATTGAITGTPTATGSTAVTVRATNANGSTNATLTISIAAAAPSAPTIANQAASGTQNAALSYQVVATGATSYSIVGTPVLPTGLSLNTTTGAITGTPTATGTTAVTVRATNATGSTNATLTITINAATPPPPPPPPPPPVQQSQTVTLITPVSTLFVGDTITLNGTATSGLPVTYSVVSGNGAISGNTLTFTGAGAVVVRAAQAGNSNWAAASTQSTFTADKRAQVVIIPSNLGGTVAAEKPVKLSASAGSSLPVTYTVVSGPATITGDTLTFTGIGTVVVRASQAGNGTYNAAETTMTFTSDPVDRLVNISSRLRVGSNGPSIAGFVVTGDAPKQMLIRAVGPTLSAFGLSDGVSDPKLTLRDNTGAVVATNAGWNNDAQIKAAADGIGAFAFPAGSKDAAILKELAPGTYTAQIESSNSGMVLIEIYDVAANAAVPTKQLINISTRGNVGVGGDAMIGGFVVGGNASKTFLIRAVGPTLGSFGVTGTLADPMLKVYDASGAVVAQNDNWSTKQPVNITDIVGSAAEITEAGDKAGAFPLAGGSTDAAVLVTLAPGQYTAMVTGSNNTTGAALVEIYEITNL